MKHELENKELQIDSLEISLWNTKVCENTKAQEICRNQKPEDIKTQLKIKKQWNLKNIPWLICKHLQACLAMRHL